MSQRDRTPPPRPKWVWAVLIVAGVAVAAMLVTHLFLGDPMKSLHGSSAAAQVAGSWAT